MLRYQQQYTFFDPAKLNSSIRFINLSQVVLEQDLSAVLEEITKEVEEANPGIVVVDSFRTVVRKAQGDNGNGAASLRSAVGPAPDQLAGHDLSDRGICRGGVRDNPVFTVADGLLWLSQAWSGIPSCGSCRS